MSDRALERGGWAVLAALLLVTLWGAATFDRSEWPSLVGDEATYAMQAASLAQDFDLAYERRDYDRFVADWGRPPDGLILQSRDGGAHLTFGKAPLYALLLAPAVRLAPQRGPAVAGALLLALAALASAWVLRRRIGPAAPLWTAVFCFASVAFAYVFWVHADLFLMCTTALGLVLVYRGEPAPARRGELPDLYEPAGGSWEAGRAWRPSLRWLAAGILLAVAGAFRPFYLALLAPAAVAAWSETRGTLVGRWWRPAALVAGAVLLLGASALLQHAAGGGWSPYGGERQGFYERTGFPEVDFPAAEWSASVHRWGNTAWLFPGALESYVGRPDAGLWGWNALYLLAGRNVGLLPYFLPLVLGFAAFRGARGRWLLPWAVLAALACFLWVRPFNFYGGTGAIANRYFLPLYPALWFLAARPPRGGSGGRALAALAVAAVAAPFLLPLWSAPRAFPVAEDGRYRYVSRTARELLPYETTQSHVPGGQDLALNGVWVKLLGGGVEAAGERLALTGGGPAELLVGSPRPMKTLLVSFDREGPSALEIEGAELGETLLSPDGGIGFVLDLGEPRAVHPMWWSAEDWWLYQLEMTPLARASRPAGTPGNGVAQAEATARRRTTFTLAPGYGRVVEETP